MHMLSYQNLHMYIIHNIIIQLFINIEKYGLVKSQILDSIKETQFTYNNY